MVVVLMRGESRDTLNPKRGQIRRDRGQLVGIPRRVDNDRAT
jgi:hypothetical protein